MGLFDPGPESLILLLLVVLLLFGGPHLPKLARALGRIRAEYSRGREEIERQLRAAAGEEARHVVRPSRSAGALDPAEMPDSKVARRRARARAVRGMTDRADLERAAHRHGVASEGRPEADLREEIAGRILAGGR